MSAVEEHAQVGDVVVLRRSCETGAVGFVEAEVVGGLHRLVHGGAEVAGIRAVLGSGRLLRHVVLR